MKYIMISDITKSGLELSDVLDSEGVIKEFKQDDSGLSVMIDLHAKWFIIMQRLDSLVKRGLVGRTDDKEELKKIESIRRWNLLLKKSFPKEWKQAIEKPLSNDELEYFVLACSIV